MNFDKQIEDEDLAGYAMHALDEAETAELAARLAESSELRRRFGAVQKWLFAYGESIELTPVPEGSLERFMSRIPHSRAILDVRKEAFSFPSKTSIPVQVASRKTIALLPWTGWAVAAGLAMTAGELFYQHRKAPETAVVQPVMPPVERQLPVVPTELVQERDALKAKVVDQAREIARLTAKEGTITREAESLRASLAGQATKLKGQAEQVAEAQTEQEALRRTLELQANQVARLTNDADTARQVTEALSDPTALRVTLTKPKSRAVPTGRATYKTNPGTLVFLASNLDRLKPGKVYQLWLLPADGSQPVPAGTFAPDARGNASMVYGQFPHTVPAKGFAVTVEKEGGSQTPTLPILLAGMAGA